MNWQCIEHHKREFPIVLMWNGLGVSESGLYAAAQSVLPVSANEKTLGLPKRFDRYVRAIKAEMAVRASIVSCKIRGEARLASAWPG